MINLGEKCSAPDCDYKITKKGAIDHKGRMYCCGECAYIILSGEGEESPIDCFNQISLVKDKYV
ncbi:MAG: hypothetical protein AABW51_00155 [Nanoarchaeota archaeon]